MRRDEIEEVLESPRRQAAAVDSAEGVGIVEAELLDLL